MVRKMDYDIIKSEFHKGLTDKEIGEKYGWNSGSITHVRINRLGLLRGSGRRGDSSLLFYANLLKAPILTGSGADVHYSSHYRVCKRAGLDIKKIIISGSGHGRSFKDLYHGTVYYISGQERIVWELLRKKLDSNRRGNLARMLGIERKSGVRNYV